MATTVTVETLRLCRLAMYQLRQDVGVPDSVSAAGTDTSVTWTKCKACFDTAFAEVLKAHDWTWVRSATAAQLITTEPDNWPDDAKNALVYCHARELAVPIAGRVEDMKNCHELYQQKLHDARVHDLDGELAAITDADQKEILAAVFPVITTGKAALPMDLLAVTRRIEATKDHARAEIIAAHNWSFCRDEAMVESCSCQQGDPNYPFTADLPPKCVRPLDCRDAAGNRADWKIVGGRIRSVRPILTVTYVRNVETLDKWPPLVRRAYVSLLAADVAATVAGSSAEAQRLRAVYERDLETAILADSRATGTHRETEGRNFYADAMLRGSSVRGGLPPRWR